MPDELDCAPANATVFPGAEELCDGLDTDCDGRLPDDESDDDVDGSLPCEGDCDDNDPALYGSDYDADGSSTCAGDCDDYDPAVEGLDFDADGQSTCEGDCDDHDPDNFLGNPEVDACDGIDNDCVVDLDELDRDGDGYRPCEGDCADLNPQAYPGRPEVCDVVDNDCNGVKDDGLVVPAQWPSDGLFDAVALSVAQFHPEEPDDRWHSVASGDVNGDGYGDLIIASDNDEEPWRNATYLIHGPFCGEATVGDPAEGVANWRQQAAQATSTVGDVNNDGYDDVRTFAAVHFGPLSGEGDGSNEWGLFSWGPTHGSFKMTVVGDLNGDGIDDLAVGEDAAPWTWDPVTESWELGPGRVAIFWGPAQPGGVSTEDADAFLTVDPTWLSQRFGAEFTPGDFDGDGLTDLAISSRTPTFTTYIAYGPFTDGVRNLDQDPEASRIGGAAWGLVASDLDGDGADELLVSGLSVPGDYWVGAFAGPIPRGSVLGVVDADWADDVSYAAGLVGRYEFGPRSCLIIWADNLAGTLGEATSMFCGSLSALTLQGVFENAVATPIGDLNGDGQPDLFVGDGDGVYIVLGPTPVP